MFEPGQFVQEILIPILPRNDPLEERDELFAVQLYEVKPSEARLSKRDTQLVQIITDYETADKEILFREMIKRVQLQERMTWWQQILSSVTLHPTKNAEGLIVEVSSAEALIYIVTIAWKVLSNVCPPAHFANGWACLFISLVMIGGLTVLLHQISTLLSCVMGIKPGVLAITLIAAGTGLQDAFASYRAAAMSKSADASIGNLLGVNTASLLLGLGIPWVIGIIYHDTKQQESFPQPRAGMLFAIALYLITSFAGLVVVAVRRCTGGEVGGSKVGRYLSALVLLLLWAIFIVLVCLQEY